MFRHSGQSRKKVHNLKLAALLSFVAGIVNVTGFFAVRVLTTNVTGHFAYFADSSLNGDITGASAYLFYILSFLAGAFVCSCLIELSARCHLRYGYLVPVFVEAILLLGIAMSAGPVVQYERLFAGLLLFAMGLQNAMVTRISNAVVRTTHLTGLFTDMGIELSQLLFFREPLKRRRLRASLLLRSTIILFFFLGCVAGGVGFGYLGVRTLFIAAAILMGSAVYNRLRYYLLRLKRHYAA